jgi:hypothetical protein
MAPRTLERAGSDALGHPPQIGAQHEGVDVVRAHQRDRQGVGQQRLEGSVVVTCHEGVSGFRGQDRGP